MTLDKDSAGIRQMDDFLMRRLDALERSVDEMRKEFLSISAKLDKMAISHDIDQPSISAMKKILDAGGMLRWAVSTVVVVCAGFAAIVTAIESFNRWLGK